MHVKKVAFYLFQSKTEKALCTQKIFYYSIAGHKYIFLHTVFGLH